jgi:hypothetical protein
MNLREGNKEKTDLQGTDEGTTAAVPQLPLFEKSISVLRSGIERKRGPAPRHFLTSLT